MEVERMKLEHRVVFEATDPARPLVIEPITSEEDQARGAFLVSTLLNWFLIVDGDGVNFDAHALASFLVGLERGKTVEN